MRFKRIRTVHLLTFAFLTSSSFAGGVAEKSDIKSFDFDRYGGKKYCLESDFDGNGIVDIAAPAGEGWITVFMNFGTEIEQVMEIDAGGVAEVYSPRKMVDPNNEPSVQHPSILVRWVGQEHVVYTWNGKGFKKITFPGSYEIK